MDHVWFGLSTFLMGMLAVLTVGGWHGWWQRSDPLLYALGMSMALGAVVGSSWWLLTLGLLLAAFGLLRRHDWFTAGTPRVWLSLAWLNPILDATPEWLRQYGQRALVISQLVGAGLLTVNVELVRLSAGSWLLITLLAFWCDRLNRFPERPNALDRYLWNQQLTAIALIAGLFLTVLGWQGMGALVATPATAMAAIAAWILWWEPVPPKPQVLQEAETKAAKLAARQLAEQESSAATP